MLNSVFQERIKSKKLFLYVATIAIFIVDVLLAIIVGVSGELFSIGLPVFLILLVDIMLGLGVHFSNFRLKYSRVIPIVYVVLSLIAGVLVAPLIAVTVFTIIALALFVVFRIIAVVAIVVGLMNGANRGFGIRFVSLLVTSVLVAVSACYAVMALSNGFYGQGGFGQRNLSYQYYQDEDGYVATLVKSSKGKTITIANEFNGKKVVGFDAKILAIDGVKEVKIECDTGFIVFNDTYLNQINSNLIISTDKERIDEVREYVYSIVKSENSYVGSRYVNLANAISPSGLSENEVYMTFDYTLADLKYVNFETIDTWFGTKGQTFNLVEHAKGVSYVDGYDITSEDFLQKCYENGGKTLHLFDANNSNVVGTQINESNANIEATFEYVRKVVVEEDNDTVYNLFSEDADFSNGGSARYVLESDPFDLLKGIKSRDGFTFEFRYSTTSATEIDAKSPFALLSAILNTDVYISPVWTLEAPTLTSIQKNQTTYVYGDTLNLHVQATHDVCDQFEYAWSKDFSSDLENNDGATYEKEVITPNGDSGIYEVCVTALNPQITSLKSTGNISTYVEVNRKDLTFTWEEESGVYNGKEQTITAIYDDNAVVQGDVIQGTIDGGSKNGSFTSSERNVGTYYYYIDLRDDLDEFYEVRVASHTWEIAPYNLNIAWGETSFIYNADTQMPSIVDIPVIGDDNSSAVSYYVMERDGETAKNVGKYVAQIVLTDDYIVQNYTIVNPTLDYTINKKPVTIAWSVEPYEYDKTSHCPTATVNEVCSDDIVNVRVSGAKVDAGTYTATADSLTGNSSSNYTFDATYQKTQSFTIDKKLINISWVTGTEKLVYSYKAICPTAQAIGLCSGDSVEFEYTGKQTNVGSNYQATATLKTHKNYYTNDGTISTLFNISQKEVTITWTGISKTYSGTEQKPTATVVGKCTGDSCSANVSLTGAINVGSYSASATLSNNNYKIKSGYETSTFNIIKKGLTITANNKEITYGDAPTNAGVTYSGFVAGENESNLAGTLSYAYTYSQYGNNGSYSITPSGYSSDNYNIVYNNGTLTVKQRELTVTIHNKQSLYNDTLQSLTASITQGNLVGGDETPYSLSFSSGTPVNAGNYTIKGSVTNNNYKITFVNGTYTITPKTINISWNTQASYTLSNYKNLQASADISGVNMMFTYKYEVVAGSKGAVVNNAPTKAGTYKVTVTVGNGNYVVANQSQLSVTFTIK